MSRTSSGVVGLLAEPDRLRVVSALALGATTIPEVAAASGLDPKAAVAALRRLERGGLVSREKDQLTLHAERFKEAAREAAPAEVVPLSADPATDAVLRAHTRDGRLTGLPAQRSKRMLVLEHVAGMFEPGVRYPEPEVDAMMRAWHPDYAMLRRYLVDAALLAREGGVYWRIGGPVLDTPTAAAPARRVQRIAAYGLIRRDGEVLLTHLSRGDATGRWTLPGGGLDFGERPADAVVREAYEETGLTVRVDELLDVEAELLARTDPDGTPVEAHPVRILYRATVLGGTLGVVERDGSTDDARWWPLDAPPDLVPMAARAVRHGRFTP